MYLVRLIDNNLFKIHNSKASYCRQKINNNSDYLKRILYIKFEILKIIIKIIKLNKYITHVNKINSIHKILHINKFAFKEKFINYCLIKGRKYSVNTKYKISKYAIFKDLTNIKFLQN